MGWLSSPSLHYGGHRSRSGSWDKKYEREGICASLQQHFCSFVFVLCDNYYQQQDCCVNFRGASNIVLCKDGILIIWDCLFVFVIVICEYTGVFQNEISTYSGQLIWCLMAELK